MTMEKQLACVEHLTITLNLSIIEEATKISQRAGGNYDFLEVPYNGIFVELASVTRLLHHKSKLKYH